MSKKYIVLGGILGAGLMYFLDPDRGRTRRAKVRERVNGSLHETSRSFGKTVRHLGNRTHGVFAETGALFRHETPIDDVLIARVRSKLGRLVRHPHGIEVTAHEGHVTLKGVLRGEDIPKVDKAVRAIRGVVALDNSLEARELVVPAEGSSLGQAIGNGSIAVGSCDRTGWIG